jgi:arsenite methyltransferase
MDQIKKDKIRQAVRINYGKVAQAGNSGCCPTSSCCSPGGVSVADTVSMRLGYSNEEVSAVPEGANMGLGCGNPQAIASLKPGEIVLDHGSCTRNWMRIRSRRSSASSFMP